VETLAARERLFSAQFFLTRVKRVDNLWASIHFGSTFLGLRFTVLSHSIGFATKQHRGQGLCPWLPCLQKDFAWFSAPTPHGA
jgi:hypothetical protein